jgi:competence/damage-inducible protein CinA-like protein
MKIGILSTGDELLRGAISDTNAAWMASQIDDLGLTVQQITVVGDDLNALEDALRKGFKKYDLLLVGGGLGPTDDDLTAEAAALAANCIIERNNEAVGQVRHAFERFGRPMVDINLKQADLPKDCIVLENKRGTAPGFMLETESGRTVFLPGVPHELKGMFRHHVLPVLIESSVTRKRLIFKCFGMGESNIQEALRPITVDFPDIRWGYRASFPEIGIMLTSVDGKMLEDAGRRVSKELGPAVFATEQIDLPTVLGHALAAQKKTLATAESCTGGLIGHAMTEVEGSSAYFKGAVVAYANEIKEEILGVRQSTLAECGAVSEEVVRQMAVSVKERFKVDLGLAVSGIAGPGGGTEEKPIGLVHMAVAHADGVDHKRRIFQSYGRSRVKLASAWTAMWMAFDVIRKDK